MRLLFKKLSIVIGVFTLLGVANLFPISKVEAFNPIDPSICTQSEAQNSSICKDNPNDPNGSNPVFGPNGIMTIVINILSLVAGVVAVFCIIVGGVKFVTSGGDSNGVASARRTILYAVISIIVTAASQALVRFVLNKL